MSEREKDREEALSIDELFKRAVEPYMAVNLDLVDLFVRCPSSWCACRYDTVWEPASLDYEAL